MASETDFAFKIIDGHPLPTKMEDGEQPDGVTILTVDEVAKRFGGTSGSWKDTWGRMIGHFAATVEYVQSEDELENTRRVRFPHIKDDRHWNFVKDECRRRGIDVGDIWVEMKFNRDRDKLEPVIITTIKALRQIADQTGQRDGESSPEFCDAAGKWTPWPWLDKKTPPTGSRVTVYRKNDSRHYPGEAAWDRCAQFTVNDKGERVYPEAWDLDRGGADQLAKCAAASAYRKAFPRETGGVVIREERLLEPTVKRTSPLRVDGNTQSTFDSQTGEVVAQGIAPSSSAAPDLPDDPRHFIDKVNESTPDLERLPLELVYRSLSKSLADSKSIIDKCRKLFPKLYRHPDSRYFCEAVLEYCGAASLVA